MISPRLEKEKICDTEGCSNIAERSININKIVKSSLKLKNKDVRQVHLCKQHYKVVKKDTRKDVLDYIR
ncbi:MAG: hypothetical protein MJY64_02575 [archaeon]|nr:hypothetical protein [archaeon]